MGKRPLCPCWLCFLSRMTQSSGSQRKLLNIHTPHCPQRIRPPPQTHTNSLTHTHTHMSSYSGEISCGLKTLKVHILWGSTLTQSLVRFWKTTHKFKCFLLLQLNICLGWIFNFSPVTALCLCSASVSATNLLIAGHQKTSWVGFKYLFWWKCPHVFWKKKKKGLLFTPKKQLEISPGVLENMHCCDSSCGRLSGSTVVCNKRLLTSWSGQVSIIGQKCLPVVILFGLFWINIYIWNNSGQLLNPFLNSFKCIYPVSSAMSASLLCLW